jgi:hypothetical protein
MRTTVTLDKDVERILKSAMRDRRVSFKRALNDAIRTGLRPSAPKPKRRYVQKTYSLGPERRFRWDKALAMTGAIEDEELIRKLAIEQNAQLGSCDSDFARMSTVDWHNALE